MPIQVFLILKQCKTARLILSNFLWNKKAGIKIRHRFLIVCAVFFNLQQGKDFIDISHIPPIHHVRKIAGNTEQTITVVLLFFLIEILRSAARVRLSMIYHIIPYGVSIKAIHFSARRRPSSERHPPCLPPPRHG